MKKQLLCTSAIALGVAAAPAAAQDWNLDWGGFFNTHVAVGDISTNLTALGAPGGTLPGTVGGQSWDGDGVDVFTNPEIIFSPSVTLDNGMTFGINIQMEGTTSGGPNIDESYASMSSDTFGRLDVGNENSAGYKLMTAAPEVTSLGINSPSTSAFIPFTGVDAAISAGMRLNAPGLGNAFTASLTALPFRQASLSAFTEVGGNNDVSRITYYTPDFNGLTVGLSYAPTAAINAGNSFSINRNAVISDVFDIGVNYSNTFGSTDITLSARWGTGDTPSVAAGASDPETWGVGFQVGFGNFTVGGSYTENDNDETLIGRAIAAPTVGGAAIPGATGAPAGTIGFGDSEGWSLGVTYDTAGPWSFEAVTYQSETDLVNAGAVIPGAKTDRELYRIGASRTLGPGVDWDIYVIHETRDATLLGILPGDEVEGTLLGTAINLSF
ncbi:porin [Roseovarius amoyensis]|uniref:porin n=1 Tax=Roseovarius amoyensis TaxID=2211448 RepID=UPI000DBE5BE2|nr:porin [Roseovarius amoyensis]